MFQFMYKRPPGLQSSHLNLPLVFLFSTIFSKFILSIMEISSSLPKFQGLKFFIFEKDQFPFFCEAFYISETWNSFQRVAEHLVHSQHSSIILPHLSQKSPPKHSVLRSNLIFSLQIMNHYEKQSGFVCLLSGAEESFMIDKVVF